MKAKVFYAIALLVLFVGSVYVSYNLGFQDSAKVCISAMTIQQGMHREECATAVQKVLDTKCPTLREELLQEIQKEKGGMFVK